MIVVANNKFGIGSNGTINEFIIVGVLGNDIPLIIGTNPLCFGYVYQAGQADDCDTNQAALLVRQRHDDGC